MRKLLESVIGHLGVLAGRFPPLPWIYARTCDVISGQVAVAVDDLN